MTSNFDSHTDCKSRSTLDAALHYGDVVLQSRTCYFMAFLVAVSAFFNLCIWRSDPESYFAFLTTAEVSTPQRMATLSAAIMAIMAALVWMGLSNFSLARLHFDRKSSRALTVALTGCLYVAALLPANRGRFLEYEFPITASALILLSCVLFSRITTWLWRFGQPTSSTQIATRRLVFILLATMTVYFVLLVLSRYKAMNMNAYDTTWEHQAMWSIAMHGAPRVTIGWFDGLYWRNHTPYIYYFIAPIYRLFPRIESFFILQTVFIMSAAIPLYLWAGRRTKDTTIGLLVGAAYLLHPSVHGFMLFDLHSAPLGIPFLFWGAYFCERRKVICAVLFFLCGAIAREEMFLAASAVCLYCHLLYRDRVLLYSFAALILLFSINTFVVMPACGGGVNYGHFGLWWGDGQKSLWSAFLAGVFKPLFAMRYLLDEKKIEFLVLFALPFGGVFLNTPWKFWCILVPGLLMTVGAWNSVNYTLGYQYSAPLVTAVALLQVEGISRTLRNASTHARRYLICALLLLAVVSNYYYGSVCARTLKIEYVLSNLLTNAEYRYNTVVGLWSRWPQPSAMFDELAHLYESIPASAEVSTIREISGMFSGRWTIRELPACSEYNVDLTSGPQGCDPREYRTAYLGKHFRLMIRRSLPLTEENVPLVNTSAPGEGFEIVYSAQDWGTLNAGRSVSGEVLSIGGQRFAYGIGTHANSIIVLNLNDGATRLIGGCGIDDQACESATARCFIRVDHEVVFASPLFRKGGRAEWFNIPASGARVIELLSESTADGVACDHVNWVDLRAE